ncbi:MAG: channel accessory protein ArfC, partial [Mycobacterium sp.]
MIHVHWWLFGLSFVMGLVLTLGLLARPVKQHRPAAVPQSRPHWPTTNATAVDDFFTIRTPAATGFPTTIPVEEEAPSAEIPAEVTSPPVPAEAAEEFVATKTPAEDELPAAEIPVEEEAPPAEVESAPTAAAEEFFTTTRPVPYQFP